MKDRDLINAVLEATEDYLMMLFAGRTPPPTYDMRRQARERLLDAIEEVVEAEDRR